MAKNTKLVLDASGVYFKEFNEKIRAAVADGVTDIVLENVNGQRYIADAMAADVSITIKGVPGQDMGSFMRGPRIRVEGNAQDGVGNTMDDGRIVITGLAGDVLG